MKKKALITGITGQDGTYLTEFLINNDYEVHGLIRKTHAGIVFPNEYIYRNLEDRRLDIHLHYADVGNTLSILNLLKETEVDEIYNLAAQSEVRQSFIDPEGTMETDGLGVLRILEAMRILGLQEKVKFFQPSSSELFGVAHEKPQTERTPFYPKSPYAIAKLYAHWIAINYREAYNMYICNGILYNHESPLRKEVYVTRKITSSVARIHLGLQNVLSIGNLDVQRDWGYAKEYTEAMYLMLQQEAPDDYIIATGEAHTVQEFIEKAFEYVDVELEWEGNGVDKVAIEKRTGRTLVKVDPQFFRVTDIDYALGDASKAKAKLSWEPKVNFDTLVHLMVEEDLKRLHTKISVRE